MRPFADTADGAACLTCALRRACYFSLDGDEGEDGIDAGGLDRLVHPCVSRKGRGPCQELMNLARDRNRDRTYPDPGPRWMGHWSRSDSLL